MDGRWIYFAGKSSEQADWQIYKVNAGGGRPQLVTHMPGGAMDPALAAHEELVFSCPVPKAGRLWTTPTPAALYGQMPSQAPAGSHSVRTAPSAPPFCAMGGSSS